MTVTHRAGESAAFQRQLSTGRIDPIRCHDPRNKHMAATPVIYSTKFFFQIRIFSEISIPQPPIFIGSVSTALPPVPPANLHECKASRLTYLAQHPSQHVVVTFVRTRPLPPPPPPYSFFHHFATRRMLIPTLIPMLIAVLKVSAALVHHQLWDHPVAPFQLAVI